MKKSSASHQKPKVFMLLTNPFQPDPRVLKEARSLSFDYDVTIWALDPEGRYLGYEEVEGVRIQRVRLTFLRLLRPVMLKLHLTLLIETVFFYIKSLQLFWRDFQIVHSHDLPPLPLAVFLGKLKGVKIVFDAHEDFAAQVGFLRGRLIERLLCVLERGLVRHVDDVIVIGEIMREEYRKRTRKPVQVVGNWNDPEDFKEMPNKLVASRARKARDENKLIVSYLTGINPSRILLPLLEAAREDPDVFILVAGGLPENPLAKCVEHIMADLSNGSYLGWLDHGRLMAYFLYTDVVYYCLHPGDPNNKYSAGNTVFSALATGKAVITTEIGEVGRLVKRGNCGVVMSEASKQEILAAFAKLKDLRYLRMCQKNAMKTAQSYTWSRAEKTLLELYRNLLERPISVKVSP
ncbi:MAG: glycosyltransferase [candidate division Zixibacteria bacterium]|nr:glycosyltransferase [candidate division Zixibacteria bacterium]